MATLSRDEIDRRLAGLEGWQSAGTGGEDAIALELELADFAAALALVNRIGALAEAVNHHPDLLIHGWNKVRVTLSTHSEGGLTAADFDLAAEIDGLG